MPCQTARENADIETADPPYKSNGLIKRQAARFRVWEYTEADGVWSPTRELSLADDDVSPTDLVRASGQPQSDVL